MSGPGDEAAGPSPEPAAAPIESPSDASADAAPIESPSAAPSGRLNLLAVLSLVLAAGYFVVGISVGFMGHSVPSWFIAIPVAAVIAGYVARGQIWRNRQRGRSIASAGVTLGYVALALLAFGWALSMIASRF